MKEYEIVKSCGCCKGGKRPFKTGEGNPFPCPYCNDTGKVKVKVPHPSHKMTKWRTEILAPCGTPRFYGVRHCKACGEEEWKHPAGHFLHRLGYPCKLKMQPGGEL